MPRNSDDIDAIRNDIVDRVDEMARVVRAAEALAEVRDDGGAGEEEYRRLRRALVPFVGPQV